MKQLMGAVAVVLALCLILVVYNLTAPYRSVSMKFPSPKQADATVSLQIKIPKNTELTKVEGNNQNAPLEASLTRDGEVIGRLVCDSASSYSNQESVLEIYKVLMNRETVGWSFIRSRQSLNLKQIISKLVNADSDDGVLVQDKKSDMYVGIEIRKDALTDEAFDVLATGVAIK